MKQKATLTAPTVNLSGRTRLILNLILIAAAIGLTVFTQNEGSYLLKAVIMKGAVYAVLAVSMNLLNGFTGLFSLGQAGFMLLGALSYSMLTIPVEMRDKVYSYVGGMNSVIHDIELPWWIAMIVAGLVACLLAFLIGLPVLRLKSDYLAIATLGFAEVIRAIVVSDQMKSFTNGSYPLKSYPAFEDIYQPLAIAAVCVILILLLINSTYGRAFKAIRDDEIAAEAMGINLAHHKRLSFVISSFFAGVGGAMLAMFQTTVSSKSFMVSMTYEILLIVVIGGIGSVTGSIVASFLYIACSEWWLRFLDQETMIGTFQVPLLKNGFRMVVFSVVIMIIVLFFRRGMFGDREPGWNRVINGILKIVYTVKGWFSKKEKKSAVGGDAQ